VADRVALVPGAKTGPRSPSASSRTAGGSGYATQDDEAKHEGPPVDLCERYGEDAQAATRRMKGDTGGPIVNPRGRLDPAVPLGRSGKPEEVGALVA
jgi:hypothetical protein